MGLTMGTSVSRIRFFGLLLLLAEASCLSNTPCQANLCEEDGYFPEGLCSPNFCHCDHGIGQQITCMDGLFFNPEILVCDWMASNAGCIDRQLSATCDNKMKVYFDGELQEQDDAMADWRKTSELTIPAGTRVVAIECGDVGAQEGILASTGDGLVTDSGWQCSDQMVEGWTLTGFVPPPDTFSSPNSLGSNGVAPWGVRPGILEDAEWIWPQGTSTWAACRIQL